VELELELRDHAKVAASPAQGPEEIWVLVSAGANRLTRGRHHLRTAQAVNREAVPAHQVPDAAAQREPGDAGV
jgi:hypothetical protein